MPELDLIQQQREMLQRFRAANRQRTEAEVNAEAYRKDQCDFADEILSQAMQTAETHCKLSEENAKSGLNESFKAFSAQLAEVQELGNNITDLLIQIGLKKELDPLLISHEHSSKIDGLQPQTVSVWYTAATTAASNLQDIVAMFVLDRARQKRFIFAFLGVLFIITAVFIVIISRGALEIWQYLMLMVLGVCLVVFWYSFVRPFNFALQPFIRNLECNACGAAISEKDLICPQCMTIFEAEILEAEEPENGEHECSDCGAVVSKDDIVCPNCGASFDSDEAEEPENGEHECSDCGAVVSKDDIVCPSCGASFDSDEDDAQSGSWSEQDELATTVDNEDEQYKCSICGVTLTKLHTSCPKCGSKILV